MLTKYTIPSQIFHPKTAKRNEKEWDDRTAVPLTHKHEREEMKNIFAAKICPNLHKYYIQIMMFVLFAVFVAPAALAVDDMWTLADVIIKDVYACLVPGQSA